MNKARLGRTAPPNGGSTPKKHRERKAADRPLPRADSPEAQEAARERDATLSEPGPRTKARIVSATERRLARRVPFTVAKEGGEGSVLQIGPPHNDRKGWGNHMADAFGTSSPDFAATVMGQIAVLLGSPVEKLDVNQLNAMLAAVDGMSPQNEAEGMLAAQMVGTHHMAMYMLRQVATAQTREAVQEYGALATKLLRTYTTQIEAFAKVRRGGSQKMRVEHIHVYPGGQAIVGPVAAGEGRSNRGNGEQPYGPNGTAALEYAPGATLWGENKIGEALPVSGEQGT